MARLGSRFAGGTADSNACLTPAETPHGAPPTP